MSTYPRPSLDSEKDLEDDWDSEDCIIARSSFEATPTSQHSGNAPPPYAYVQEMILGTDVRRPEVVHLHPWQLRAVTIARPRKGLPRLSAIDSGRARWTSAHRGTEQYRSRSPFASDKAVSDEGVFRYHDTTPDDLSNRIATQQQLDALREAHPLPALLGSDTWARWRFCRLSYYMRLWSLAILANVIAIVVVCSLCTDVKHPVTYGSAAAATATNLFVSALFRQEHFINLIFRLACCLPHNTALCIRQRAAKVYHYGGAHSGCGISAFLWYVYYAVLLIRQFEARYAFQIALAVTVAFTIFLLAVIIASSHPRIRWCYHNQWELTHRFAGWTTVLLVWTQTLIIVIASAHQTRQTVVHILATTPMLYLLILATLILIYPWLRLRRRKVAYAEKLSPHAMRLHFSDTSLRPCVGYRLSANPLLENHGFATIPKCQPAVYTQQQHRHTGETGPGYSIIISNAGDWTSRIISSPHAPRQVWTRGAPTTGVMRIASLFAPVLIVATGSGIGPCLSFLQPNPGYPVRILWSCRRPLETHGTDIVRAVFKADGNAIVVDTRAVEVKVDLCALAWSILKQSGAEAIVIISNPKVTKEVVWEMERRGVPAYGAIFDS